jgi:hypothetical protein
MNKEQVQALMIFLALLALAGGVVWGADVVQDASYWFAQGLLNSKF